MSEEPQEARKAPKTPPWARLAEESDPAFEAFLAYRDAGLQRSLAAVGKSLGKSEGLVERWSSRHGWIERARAWDAHTQRAKDRALIRESVRWEVRRQAAREKQFLLSEKLTRKAMKMLKFPLVAREVTTVTRNGVAVEMTTISPAKWTFRDVLATFQVAAALRDQALGDPEADGGRVPEPSGPPRARPDADPEIYSVRRPDDDDGADSA